MPRHSTLTAEHSVSQMKHALLLLGCPSISVVAKLANGGMHMVIETSHPKLGPISVERTFTFAEYLGGPMQPVYFEIYQRVWNAARGNGST